MSSDKRDRQRANKEEGRIAAAEVDAARQRMRMTLAVVAAVVVGVVAVVLLSRGGDDDPAETATETESSTDDAGASGDADPGDEAPAGGECPAEDGSSPRTIDFTAAPPMCIDPAATHVAVFDTSEGEIRVTLDTANTPGTVNNFVTLARWGYYDGTTIHRTDPSIDIIQGGSPRTESAADPGPGYTIADEPQFETDGGGNPINGPYRYVAGQLVMARSRGTDSGGAQYFFTTGPNAALLDGQGIYVVFGETDDAGLGVLQQIIGLHEPGGQLGGAPSRTVTINSIAIEVS